MTIDSHDSDTTVVKLLSTGRRKNVESVQPRSSGLTRSTKLSVKRTNMLDLTQKRSASKPSQLEEFREEE